jgi:hypothetical protein
MVSKHPPGSIAWLEEQEAMVKPFNPAITQPAHHITTAPMPHEGTVITKDTVRVSISKDDLAALKAELQAVHSDLGDASQVIFDLLEALKEREIELATERRKTERLEESVNRLKASVSSMKNRLAPILPVA